MECYETFYCQTFPPLLFTNIAKKTKALGLDIPISLGISSSCTCSPLKAGSLLIVGNAVCRSGSGKNLPHKENSIYLMCAVSAFVSVWRADRLEHLPWRHFFSGTTVSLEIPVLHRGGNSQLRKADKGRLYVHPHR